MTQCLGSSEHWLYIPLPELRHLPGKKGKPARKQSPWLSLNDRDHWARRKKLTEYYREAGSRACADADLPPYERVYVAYWMAYGSNRRLDPHNYNLTAKAIVDGFVDYGLIRDDGSKFLVGPDPRRDETMPVGMHMQIIGLE